MKTKLNGETVNLIASKPNRRGWVHPLIKKTAQEMAEVLYESLARDNNWYALNHSREAWVSAVWPDIIPAARATLTKLLGTNIAEKLKEEIYVALCEDSPLRHGRALAQERRIKGVYR